MQYIKLFLAVSCVFFVACNGNVPAGQGRAEAREKTQTEKAAGALDQLIDTTKLKTDMHDLMQSVSEGKPDTNKLKKAEADILSTATHVLSDSGISQMGGNDPSQQAAKDAMKKMRNSMGITPAALDSMKKAAEQLGKN